MKVAVLGAGAIGGHVGARLALAGHDVTFLARGAHLQAMRERGVTVLSRGERLVARPRCVERTDGLPEQDLVLVMAKAPTLPALLAAGARLVGPRTLVVLSHNGVPWWFPLAVGGPLRDRRLESVDPGRRVELAVPAHQVIGCVVKMGGTVVEPGVVQHLGLNRLQLGEIAGGRTDRVQELAGALSQAGFEAHAHARLAEPVWSKVLENMPLSPLAMLTGATIEQLVRDPGTRELMQALHDEGRAVGLALGLDLSFDMAEREALAARLPGFKSSMLQDLEARRPMEIDALVTAVLELARHTGVDTPLLRMVHALATHKAGLLGLHGSTDG